MDTVVLNHVSCANGVRASLPNPAETDPVTERRRILPVLPIAGSQLPRAETMCWTPVKSVTPPARTRV